MNSSHKDAMDIAVGKLYKVVENQKKFPGDQALADAIAVVGANVLNCLASIADSLETLSRKNWSSK